MPIAVQHNSELARLSTYGAQETTRLKFTRRASYMWLTQLEVVSIVQIAVSIAFMITLQFFFACSDITFDFSS